MSKLRIQEALTRQFITSLLVLTSLEDAHSPLQETVAWYQHVVKTWTSSHTLCFHKLPHLMLLLKPQTFMFSWQPDQCLFRIRCSNLGLEFWEDALIILNSHRGNNLCSEGEVWRMDLRSHNSINFYQAYTLRCLLGKQSDSYWPKEARRLVAETDIHTIPYKTIQSRCNRETRCYEILEVEGLSVWGNQVKLPKQANPGGNAEGRNKPSGRSAACVKG